MGDNGGVERWRTTSRLPAVLDALTLSEKDLAVGQLIDAFGGTPIEVRERAVGEPARLSRRLLFASGGELILHDDALAAVVLHLTATPPIQQGLQLSEWIDGVDNDATLEDLTQAIGGRAHFSGMRSPYVTLDGGYARFDFGRDANWNEPGGLVGITVTVDKPGLACRPEDDDCPTCSDLLVRSETGVGVDVEGTTAALTDALAAGLLTESAAWVRLADLLPLHASGLMERVESQLTCTTCRRIICFTLFRDASPTFGYHVLNDASRRPLEAIPPVERWGDASRLEAEAGAMHYVDHEPGSWFLVEQDGVLYLEARYVVTSMADDSALIRLDESELERYRESGHDALSTLARQIGDSSPHRDTSAFHQRDLLRGPGGRDLRKAVSAAIVNHTWLAEQRRSTPAKD